MFPSPYPKVMWVLVSGVLFAGVLVAGILAAGAARAADEPAPPAGQAAGQTTDKTAPATGTATTPSGTTPKAATTTTSKAADTTTKSATTAKSTTAAATEEVAILETSKGRMVIAFWDKEAPQTVSNFKKLARQGFYDGTGFHRIIKGFMIQGGDPKSKNPKATDLGTGDPGYKINDEFNFHKHVPGVISMANSGTPNSAGSQFFIMDTSAPFLDGKYTAFGYLIEGMKAFKEIANTPVGPNPGMSGEKSKPLEWTTLKTVQIVPRSSLKATEKTDDAAAKAAAGTKKADDKAKQSTAASKQASDSTKQGAATATTGAAAAGTDSVQGGSGK